MLTGQETSTSRVKTLTALRESIAKWEARASGADESSAIPETCPLCVLFNNEQTPEASLCHGCPVFEAGHRWCEDTPYEDYTIARATKVASERRAAAQREVDFLKSLLPQERAR